MILLMEYLMETTTDTRMSRKCNKCGVNKYKAYFIQSGTVCNECVEQTRLGLKLRQTREDVKQERFCLRCDRKFEGTRYIRMCDQCKQICRNVYE